MDETAGAGSALARCGGGYRPSGRWLVAVGWQRRQPHGKLIGHRDRLCYWVALAVGFSKP